MTRLIAAVCLMLTWVAGSAFAQAYPPNEVGVTMGALASQLARH